MSNEELKQEAIKKAYGIYWEEVKYYVFKNGWCNSRFDVETEFESDRKGRNEVYWRPKSLAGIENNNGWIRIEEDGSNLPKVRSICFVFNKRGETEEFHFGKQSHFGFLSETEYVLRHFQYFQPIIKPNPPIY